MLLDNGIGKYLNMFGICKGVAFKFIKDEIKKTNLWLCLLVVFIACGASERFLNDQYLTKIAVLHVYISTLCNFKMKSLSFPAKVVRKLKIDYTPRYIDGLKQDYSKLSSLYYALFCCVSASNDFTYTVALSWQGNRVDLGKWITQEANNMTLPRSPTHPRAYHMRHILHLLFLTHDNASFQEMHRYFILISFHTYIKNACLWLCCQLQLRTGARSL